MSLPGVQTFTGNYPTAARTYTQLPFLQPLPLSPSCGPTDNFYYYQSTTNSCSNSSGGRKQNYPQFPTPPQHRRNLHQFVNLVPPYSVTAPAEPTHNDVLTLTHRGFVHSTGSPSEASLITNATSLLTSTLPSPRNGSSRARRTKFTLPKSGPTNVCCPCGTLRSPINLTPSNKPSYAPVLIRQRARHARLNSPREPSRQSVLGQRGC
ncbi:hypothetical protein EJ06DRAFT_579425 [Trichodelitschia bisporula]|uniref:Uncharacterized protein n=1 Tax=Trichodelitschia bisporula TaxID=703511 RepID=A0A6G1I5L6_9PEZI|nr:hypothetical protein EJ06DRAFT_579425 [Trichodelitschia bisporula]